MTDLGLAIRFCSVADESDSQMMEFDRLGPAARQALDYSPRDPDVKVFKQRFRADWDKKFNGGRFGRRECAFTDPEIDRMFAAYIEGILEQRMGDPALWRHLEPKRRLRPYRSRPTRLRDAPSAR